MTNFDVVVIGAGIFGSEVAFSAASIGLKVKVFESKDTIMSGASKNNQNRLHLGFHYPRDLATGLQSIRGFYAFKDKYAKCVSGQFENAYFIASQGSLTTPEDYLEFCKKLGVNFKKLLLSEFPIDVYGVDIGIMCEEVVYDVDLLKSALTREFETSNVDLALNTQIRCITHCSDGFEIIDNFGTKIKTKFLINATYSDINRITATLGYNINHNHYEYTVVPVIELNIPPIGVTIMDGPFYTLLPFGKTGKHLLYSVEKSVIKAITSKQMPKEWIIPRKSPFNYLDKIKFFDDIKKSVSSFIPEIKKAKIVDFLRGPRMVLAHNDETDARPSVINLYDDKYVTIFSGKIDHSIWVAEDIKKILRNKFCIS
ncbi:MAG: hypothetical protein CL851_05400 [Crocinitomicaceae bacterium]|nr:hypothetical protein [Crocinitomicaceae bacterium]